MLQLHCSQRRKRSMDVHETENFWLGTVSTRETVHGYLFVLFLVYKSLDEQYKNLVMIHAFDDSDGDT